MSNDQKIKTSVGEGIFIGNASWSFSKDVAKNFNEHVKKSIPQYKKGHELILQVSDFFLSGDSTCYELGTSTGTLTFQMAVRHPLTKFIGIEKEWDMVKEAESNRAIQYPHLKNLEFDCDDIIDYSFAESDMIISYYTLQFIKPKNRPKVFKKIYDSLNKGGAFILFEKVLSPTAEFQSITNSLYFDFKKEKGYTSEQIINKSRSLKGHLTAFTSEENRELLNEAGFSKIETIQKYLSFEGLLAIK